MPRRCLAVIVGLVLGLTAMAYADPRAEIAAKARAAMASYDLMDYAAARRLLNQALAIAKKAKLDKDPIVARVYLDLGIAQLAGSDQEAARVSFLSAAQIDPKITIEAGYKSPELVNMLEEAKAAAGEGGGDSSSDGVDCRAVRGLQHTVIDHSKGGAAQPIEAFVASDLAPARVVVMYRPESAIDFVEVRLTKQGSCRYAGAIPASATRGSLVHYYIAAYDANNRVLAAKGSSGTPNVMTIGAVRAMANDPEGPARGGKQVATRNDHATAGVSAGVEAGEAPPRIMLAVSGGTGLGYLTGTTEGGNQVQSCCVGASLVVIAPELGYYVSPKLSIGMAARLGLPIGANIMGHSKLAPAVFLRVRRAFSASGDGFRVMAELGGGILRNTIKLNTLETTGPGMDTDIVAQGPLLFGAGIGYTRHLSSSITFLVNLDAMAGLAVVRTLGSAIHLNTGVSADMSLGLAVGF
ncbi:MAG TPA: tetratricopeptide repeat protein [Kofleriaceae bacterium]|nr:tetratricopeptide repeat protein [Kofleriaceae bacterium]